MTKFSYFCFGNPTNKTEFGTGYTWGTSNIKPLDQTLLWTNGYTEPQLGAIYYTRFGRWTIVLGLLSTTIDFINFRFPHNWHKFGAENQFPVIELHTLTYSQ
jgi:hypothetical protein